MVIKVIKGNYHQIRLVIGAIHNQQESLCTHVGNIPKRREETKRRPFVQNEKWHVNIQISNETTAFYIGNEKKWQHCKEKKATVF